MFGRSMAKSLLVPQDLRFLIFTGEKSYECNVRKPSLIVQVLQNTEKLTLERSLINVRNVEKPLLVPHTLLYI